MTDNDSRNERENSRLADCPFCCAIQGIPCTGQDINANTLLFETGTFALIPALGPLVPGHALVITKVHSHGMKYLDTLVQADYQELSRYLREYCLARGDDLLEAEHGTAFEGQRGPCIEHTHVHLLPGLARYANIFDQRLPGLRSKAEVNTNTRPPYIWIRNATYERLYDASRAIGQEIRRALAEALSVDDWDWALSPRWNLVYQTLTYWKTA